MDRESITGFYIQMLNYLLFIYQNDITMLSDDTGIDSRDIALATYEIKMLWQINMLSSNLPSEYTKKTDSYNRLSVFFFTYNKPAVRRGCVCLFTKGIIPQKIR